MIFFFKQKTAYEMLRSLVGSEMCIRDRLKEVHRLHPSKKFFTAHRVLREVRAGVLESNEGLVSLRSIFRFEGD